MADFTPTGGDGHTSSSIDTTSAAGTSTPAEPSILDISDDNQLVRIKGSEKPVKFGDYSRGFQATATRATQERARYERDLQAARAENERYKAAEAARQQAQSQGGQQNGQDVYAQLSQLPYLDGQTAAKVVQSIAGQFQNRDRIILGMVQELQKVQQLVGTLNQSHVQSGFDSKIDKYLTDGGYGPELRELAVETYLAYEPGSDLDAEFPEILRKRVEQVTNYIEAKRQEKLNAARRSPFVPGKGGQAGPTRPLELDPRASAKDTAEKLWESMQFGPGT